MLFWYVDMKKLKHIIAILCILLCFVPATAYAKSDVSVSTVYAGFSVGSGVWREQVSVPFKIQVEQPFTQLTGFSVIFDINDKLHNGDKVTVQTRFFKFWESTTFDIFIQGLDQNGKPVGNSESIYHGQSLNSSEYTAPITGQLKKDYKNGVRVTVALTNSKPYTDFANDKTILGVDFINYDVEYKTNGLLGDIIDYIKGIFQKITEIPHKIGEFITGLGNRIGGFFTDLWDKITTKFNEFETNIKSWWSNLSQSIKDWWVNLTNSIRNWWTNLTTSIKNWWQSIIDYLKSLFVPDPNYWTAYKDKVDLFIQEHFGFLYQSGNLIVSLFETIKNGISNASPSGVIHIPEIKWIFTQNSVLVPATDFNLDTIVNANAITKSVFNMIKIAINALICYSVVLLGKKKFDEIILDREVL